MTLLDLDKLEAQAERAGRNLRRCFGHGASWRQVWARLLPQADPSRLDEIQDKLLAAYGRGIVGGRSEAAR